MTKRPSENGFEEPVLEETGSKPTTMSGYEEFFEEGKAIDIEKLQANNKLLVEALENILLAIKGDIALSPRMIAREAIKAVKG